MSRRRRSGSFRSIGLGLVATATVVAVSLTGSAMASASAPRRLAHNSCRCRAATTRRRSRVRRSSAHTPKNTPETVSFVLTEQNLSQLEASVQQGVTLVPHGEPVRQGIRADHRRTSWRWSSTFRVRHHDAGLRRRRRRGGHRDGGRVRQGALDVQQQQVSVPAQAQSGGRQAIPAQTVHAATSAAVAAEQHRQLRHGHPRPLELLGLREPGAARQHDRVSPADQHERLHQAVGIARRLQHAAELRLELRARPRCTRTPTSDRARRSAS